MVNWHLFELEDIEIGGHAGVFGENRSGKSTILDMAQIVLTGGNRNIYRLNAVAGDKGKSRGTSKRSVLNYCLGTLGEDERRRDQARTYIALGFADTEGQRPPVTIGMAIEARKSESNETVLARFVAIGKILTTQDFIEIRKEGRFPADWDDVRGRIVHAIGAENFVNHRDKAIDFVREYMRHLVPHASFVGEQNANSLQKAVVNAMTLDHDQTATEFVRKYILEDNKMRVGELRESIQTYRNINDTIRKMREKLEALKALQTVLTELEEVHDRTFKERWIARRAEWLYARAANCDLRRKLKDARAKRNAAGEELKILNEDLRAIQHEIERLSAAIVEHDTKSGRRAAAETLRAAEEGAARAAAAFQKRVEAIGLLEPLSAMKGQGFDAHLATLAKVVSAGVGAKIGSVPDSLTAAEKDLAAAAPELAKRTDEMRQKLFADAGALRSERDALRERASRHRSGQANAHLSEVTQELCRKLRQESMAPRVLCDLVEISDPQWTAAAEGLLGRDREAVFVDRPHIAKATAAFKAGRREFRGASLVSLNKLDAHRGPPETGRFPSIFRTQDADARAFLVRRYGTVRLAETMDQFNLPGRALMKDGLYDDGLVRTHRAADPTEHKIGKAAQAKALRDLEQKIEELDELVETAVKEARIVDAAHGALKTLCEDPAASAAALAAQYMKTVKERADAEERIKALDGAGDGGLRTKRTAQAELWEKRTEERDAQQDLFNNNDVEVKVCERDLAKGENSPGSDLNLRLAWSIWKQNRPLYARPKGRTAYRERLAAATQKNDTERHRAIASKAVAAEAAANEERQKTEQRVRRGLGEYFETFGVSSQVGTESEPLREVRPWAEQLIQEIETNELRRYERQAREAAEKAATLLRGEFINALTSRISKMERDLQAMNRSLHDHPFHNERYSFHHTRVADFQPILKIIEIGKTSPEALDMLFRGDQVPADFPHKDTIAELEALLEDPDKDFTQFEDYRNFYTFEIHMEDVATGRTTRWETRRGIGSGAEQQVPIYVAIGASLASVYGSAQRRPGRPAGMALAMFDEAFSKLDGKNQRQMMSFYKKLGLQIIIAAPNEKRVAVLEHIDTVVEVDRIGDGARTTVVQIKERARRELRAIDPDLMSDADLQTRIAAE
ncbi:SbcC/MukB-like Walker B domain-containing protein [Pseudorhodoplanes sp.]|uniref:SbcC/MukB-like Walker B domain-containing protein n=1 Tax=Pseudorhodoplanes sp. TaxID=1934341 RepID=UPI002B7D953A|nr:SbcC/MukB-like Walker B domain-containing protein [Pseudorhodoplanes sp.]HWV55477.1 SbcC/MukB-like Walker B domain-containing protein [Pseudorhodoplanes sp.]